MINLDAVLTRHPLSSGSFQTITLGNRQATEARCLPEPQVRELIAQHTEGHQLGVLGEPRVNVLGLNPALDPGPPNDVCPLARPGDPVRPDSRVSLP